MMPTYREAFDRITAIMVGQGVPPASLPYVDGTTLMLPWDHRDKSRVHPLRFGTTQEAESYCISILTAYTMISSLVTEHVVASAIDSTGRKDN